MYPRVCHLPCRVRMRCTVDGNAIEGTLYSVEWRKQIVHLNFTEFPLVLANQWIESFSSLAKFVYGYECNGWKYMEFQYEGKYLSTWKARLSGTVFHNSRIIPPHQKFDLSCAKRLSWVVAFRNKQPTAKKSLKLLDVTHFRRWGNYQRYEFCCQFDAGKPRTKCSWVKYHLMVDNMEWMNILTNKCGWNMIVEQFANTPQDQVFAMRPSKK